VKVNLVGGPGKLGKRGLGGLLTVVCWKAWELRGGPGVRRLVLSSPKGPKKPGKLRNPKGLERSSVVPKLQRQGKKLKT